MCCKKALKVTLLITRFYKQTTGQSCGDAHSMLMFNNLWVCFRMMFIPPALPGPKPPGPPLVATPELGIPPIPSPDPGPPPVVIPTPRPGTPSPTPELGPAPAPSPPAPRAPPGRPAKSFNIYFHLIILIDTNCMKAHIYCQNNKNMVYLHLVNVYFLFFRGALLPYLRALAPA